MPDNIEKNDSRKTQEPIDLSALVGLTFGPSWSDPQSSPRGFRVEERGKERSSRPSSRPSARQGRPGGVQRDRRPAIDRSGARLSHEVFHPTVDVAFYPEDEPFLALIKAIRVSCKTYELFELARLILEKPERFVAVIHARRSDKNPLGKFYVCPFDAMPFEFEEEAIQYGLKNHIDKFFEVEDIVVDPPKGSFPVISRCGITGELLGPPNYHRYQDLLKEHHANRLSNMPYEKFLSKIESVKDEEAVKAWSEKMSKSKRYTLNKVAEGEEKPVFNTWEDMRSFILSKHKKEFVQECASVRFHGGLLDKMPRGDIKRSVEVLLKAQRDFPLDTANNIRGRLRRMNLSIYKKGSKGITYVCAVKRRFRQEGVSFSENLQSLVDFIEKHPNCLASKLPELYLGIQQPSAIPVSEDIENTVVTAPNSEQQSQVRKLMLDLRWLVSEGYVTEYGNTMLYAPSPVSSAKIAEEEKFEEKLETHEESMESQNVQNVVTETVPGKVSELTSESEDLPKASIASKKSTGKKKLTKKLTKEESPSTEKLETKVE